MTEEEFHQRIIAKYEGRLARIQRDEGRDAMRSRWSMIRMLLEHRRALCSLQDSEWSVGVHVPLLPTEDAVVRVEGGENGALVVSYQADRVQSRQAFFQLQDKGESLASPVRARIKVEFPLYLEIVEHNCDRPEDRERAASDLGGFGDRTRSCWGERFDGFCFEIENSREIKRLRELRPRDSDFHHWRLWLGGWLVEAVGVALEPSGWPADKVTAA